MENDPFVDHFALISMVFFHRHAACRFLASSAEREGDRGAWLQDWDTCRNHGKSRGNQETSKMD